MFYSLRSEKLEELKQISVDWPRLLLLILIMGRTVYLTCPILVILTLKLEVFAETVE